MIFDRFYLIGVKVSGGLLLVVALCNFWAGRGFYAVLNLVALAVCCWFVHWGEGWNDRSRFFADVSVFELSFEDLQERIECRESEPR